MRTIEVQDDIFAALEARATGFGATPSSVIRDLLKAADTYGALESASVNSAGQVSHPLIDLISSAPYRNRDAKGRYFVILKFIHDKHEHDLGALLGYKRGSRVNFARDAESIDSSGTSTNPQNLPGTPLYVLTNLNNGDKRTILQDLLSLYHYPQDVIREVTASIPDSGIFRPKRARIDGLL